MIIAMSAKGIKKDDLLDGRFGRCEYFQFYNTETKEFRVVENQGVSSGGGAGIAAASQVIDVGADVIVTGSLGPNAYELVEKARIKAYHCSEKSITEVIDLYQKNQLEEISTAGKSHHGMNS